MTPDDGVSTDAQQNRQYDVAPDGRFLIDTELNGAAALQNPKTLLNSMPPGEGVASREEGCRRGASFLFP
jgi:hypothetical protein